jgi:choline monooxygenase
MDIIFVNINGNEIDLMNILSLLKKDGQNLLSKEDQNLLVHSKDYGYFSLDVKSNWKFAIENYCESYHLPWIHPELNKVSNIK